MQHLLVGAFSPSVVLRLARRSGRLAAADLDVEEVPVPSSPAQFTALLDGGLDAALTSPDNVLAYRFDPANPLRRTADVRIVAAVDRGMGLGLYLAPGQPADPAALRGRRFGVDVETSGFALAMFALAADVGLERADLDVVALGSTPKRLAALLAGECAATMLNAGNELVAEAAGATCLRRLVDVRHPYLGTVLAVAGPDRLAAARRLAAALRATAAELVAGGLRDAAVDEAGRSLRLGPHEARRYADRLVDPDEGLVPDGVVDAASLRTLVQLRSAALPDSRAEQALEPGSGLVDAGPS